MKRAVLVLALLRACSAAPAWAGEPEKAQLRALVESAAPALGEALRELSARPGNEHAIRSTIHAYGEMAEAFTRLAGINPANEGDRPAIERWDAQTRDWQLRGEDGAFFHLDRAIGATTAAIILNRQTDRAAIAQLKNARAALKALDRTLSYEAGAEAPLIGRPGVGHGDVNLTVKQLNTSLGYDRRKALDEWLVAYEDLGPDPVLQMQYSQWIVIQGETLRAMAELVGAYDPEGATVLERSCIVLRAYTERLWTAVPQAYLFAMHHDPLADGWKTKDNAGKSGFKLPACEGAR